MKNNKKKIEIAARTFATEVKAATEETFESLCKELGKRISSSENALLCWAAYQAYEKEKRVIPKGAYSSEPFGEKLFRKEAAKLSGVGVSTIDALLQVGKSIATLPTPVRESAAIGRVPLRDLRKLATDKFDKTRQNLLETFIKAEKVDPKSARKALQAKITPPARTGVETKVIIKPEAHYLTPGEHIDVKVGRFTVVCLLQEVLDGRAKIAVSGFKGDKKQIPAFLNATDTTPKKPAKPVMTWGKNKRNKRAA